jgi:hypothetical protein
MSACGDEDGAYHAPFDLKGVWYFPEGDFVLYDRAGAGRIGATPGPEGMMAGGYVYHEEMNGGRYAGQVQATGKCREGVAAGYGE